MESKIFLGMTMALIGIVIVFLLLIVIAVTIVSILKTLKSLQTQVTKDVMTPPAAPAAPIQAFSPSVSAPMAPIPAFSPSDSAPVASGTIDPSIVAVITAAVAMMMSEPSVGSLLYPGFRVRSIRRVI